MTLEGLHEDFRDLLVLFADADVEFVVVGAYALAFHGAPRASGDIDLFIRPSSANAGRVFDALARFGAPLESAGVTPADFTRSGTVYQIGLPPRRIDVLTGISGVIHWLTQGLGLSTSPEKDFIKRVIGLPGDRVEVRVGANGVGVVYVNDVPLREPYLNALKETRPYGPVTVPAGDLFVMGDNRMNSNDSRYGLGFIPADKVVGRAFIIIWPPSRFRWLSGINYS